jgi:hypothetical protein
LLPTSSRKQSIVTNEIAETDKEITMWNQSLLCGHFTCIWNLYMTEKTSLNFSVYPGTAQIHILKALCSCNPESPLSTLPKFLDGAIQEENVSMNPLDILVFNSRIFRDQENPFRCMNEDVDKSNIDSLLLYLEAYNEQQQPNGPTIKLASKDKYSDWFKICDYNN